MVKREEEIMPETLWDAREAAAYLGVSRSKVYAMAADGTLPHVKIGDRVVRFPPAMLAAWVQDNTHPGGKVAVSK